MEVGEPEREVGAGGFAISPRTLSVQGRPSFLSQRFKLQGRCRGLVKSSPEEGEGKGGDAGWGRGVLVTLSSTLTRSQARGDQEEVGAPEWRLREKAQGRGPRCYLFRQFQLSCLFMSLIYFYSPLPSIT